MYSNPIIEKQEREEEERRKQEAFRYPMKICCVYRDSENNDFPIIHEVRAHCHENHLVFTAREYDADKYEEDSWIKKLPAFHLYFHGGHCDIFYYDNNPVHKIQKELWAYQEKEKKREERARKRKEQWNGWILSMRSVFKKKTLLDLDASLRSNSENNISPRSGSV